MVLKKTLLLTTAVLISLQPVLAQAQHSGDAALVQVAQAESAQWILQAAQAELEAAKAALATAQENKKGVKKAQNAVKAARAKVEEAKENLAASNAAETAAEEPKAKAKKKPKKNAEKSAEKAVKNQKKPAEEKSSEAGDSQQGAKTGAKKSNDVAVEKKPKQESSASKQQVKADPSDAESNQVKKKRKRVQDAEAAPEDREPPKKKITARKPEQKAKPVAEQLEQAAEKPVAVLPEKVSAKEKAALAAAEQERRDEARKRRNELLGAAAVGIAVGVVAPILGGKLVEDQGDRVVIERDGDYFIRKDENALLRRDGVRVDHFQLEGGRSREIMTRPNGVQIITLRSSNGDILRRERITPDGAVLVLINNPEPNTLIRRDFARELPPLNRTIDHGLYVVSAANVEEPQIVETFAAPPVEEVRETYALREIRESQRLRDIVRRLDLDTIVFDSGSSTVRHSQVGRMGRIANAMAEVLNQNPSTVFLIEGHTDAVGGEIYNLALSDRRAETVARILIDSYGLPPENFVVEGYGEAFLKIDTQADEVRNRRVAIRNITPLLTASN